MNQEKEINEEESVEMPSGKELEPVPGDNAWNRTVDKISYKGIVKNMPYLIFLTLLAIIYIANNNYAISLVRELDAKKKELKEVHWRYMDLQSKLMFQTSESQLKIKTATLGLKPLAEPAFEVRIKGKQRK